MTVVRAARCSSGLPDTNLPGTTNNYTSLQEFTADSDKAGGKVDVQLTPSARRCSAATASAISRPTISRTSRCRPAAPATGTSTRATGSSSSASTWAPTGRSLLEARLRLFVDAGGEESAGARLGQRVRSVRAGRACRPTAASPAACRRSSLPATRISDARRPTRSGSTRPSTTRRSTTRGRRGAHSFKTGYEFQRISTEVQDVNPLYGRDTYNGSVHAAGRRGGEQPLQPRRLHARPARAVRAQQRPRRQPAPEHALRLRAGRLARGQPADAEPRRSLRVLDAVLGEGQHPVELRSGDEHDGHREGRIDLPIARSSTRTATTSGRVSASPTR